MPNLDRLSAYAPKVLSLLRIMLGLLLLQYGLQKNFQWPAGYDKIIDPFTIRWLGKMMELILPFFIIAGYQTRIAAFLLAGQFTVGYFMVHAPNSFFPLVNGGSLAVTWVWAYFYIFFAGGGDWSLDAYLARGSKPATA